MVNVVEVGEGIAVKLLGRYLCDLGWDVRAYAAAPGAQPPYAPDAWAQLHATLQASKRALAREDLATELEFADVLIEDTNNLVALGVDTANLRLLHIALPAYASEDAEHRAFATSEAAVLAASGVLSDMGLNRTLLGVRASFTHLPMASVYGSMFGMCALMSELVQGHTEGRVEVPLASALTEALVHNSITFPIAEKYVSRRKQHLAKHGSAPVSEEALDQLFDPFFTFYTCACGHKVYLVCPAHARHQLDALRVLRVQEEVQRITGVVDAYGEHDALGIGCGNLDVAQSTSVRAILKRAFLQRTADAWERALGEARVPAVMVRSLAEWRASAHAVESGLVQRDGLPCPPFWAHVTHRDPRAATGPTALPGLRVVDATNVIAGPTIGMLLARFGCDVIKVDPPRPSYAPDVTVIYGLPANVGKHSMLLDVKSAEGRCTFEALLRTADVLIVNTTEDGMQRMGFTTADLARINPRMVVTRFDAWGGPRERGPFSNFLGYDDNVQAATGIMVRFGGSHETCEEHAHVGTIDTIAGVCGAASTLHALYRRGHCGEVCEARTSLAAVSQYLQYPFFVVGEPACVGGTGIRCMGVTPTYCVYKTADAHVILTGAVPAGALGYEEMCALAATKTARELADHFEGTGVAVTRLRSMAELRQRFTVERPSLSLGTTYQYVECTGHPLGRVVMAAPNAMRLPIRLPASMVAPKYGQDTLSVLHSLKRCHTYRAQSYSRDYLPIQPPCTACGTAGGVLAVVDCAHNLCESCIAHTRHGVCPCCTQHSPLLETLQRRILRQRYTRWRMGSWYGAVQRSAARDAVGFPRSRSHPGLAHYQRGSKAS